MRKHVSRFGYLEVIEIIQIGTILFLFAMLGSFVISLIFTEIDKKVDEIDDGGTKTLVIFTETYIQLLITAIAYFYIEKIIYWFPSIASILNRRYETYKSVNYVIHIILIIVLIEMNASLQKGVHYLQHKLNVNGH